MSYRFNTIDIIVGFGMCAIIFGALLFFVAANGTYQVALPSSRSPHEPSGLAGQMKWLQPALGQAIVDQALSEHRSHRAIALSASEWNQATLAHQGFRSRSGGSLGIVLRQAVTVPADHLARVQEVMGRAIVNFTKRGVRNGLLSADLYQSGFNLTMIRKTELRGQRLHDEFAASWQGILGSRIVDAVQRDGRRAGLIQERLGAALLQLVQAQAGLEASRATQQQQLGSLIVAVIRSGELADRGTMPATVGSSSEEEAAVSTEPAFWPEIPIGFVILASILLVAAFLGGLSLATHSRERRTLAEKRYDAARWVYRMAA